MRSAVVMLVLVVVAGGCSNDGHDEAIDEVALLMNGATAAVTSSRWASNPCLGEVTFSITEDGDGRQQRGCCEGALSGVAVMMWTRQGERGVLFTPEALNGGEPACTLDQAECLGSIKAIAVDADGLGFSGEVGFVDGYQTTCDFVKVGGDWKDCGGCAIVADRCVAGACRCGSQAPCTPGTPCEEGACGCTVACASGCCSGRDCLGGGVDTACGWGGVPCQDCTVSGQFCRGFCGDACPGSPPFECWTPCNATTCPDGCCSDQVTCVSPPRNDACGLNGAWCETCGAPPVTDNCDVAVGQCMCGSEPPCTGWETCSPSGTCY